MRSPYHFPPAVFVFLVLWCGACADDGGGGVNEPPSAGEVVIVSGDNQRTRRGGNLPAPLRVRVLAVDKQPLPGATVHWSVTQGEATLDPTESTTGASGEAETRAILGSSSGSIVVSATVEDLAPVMFSITALEPSAFISISAGTFHTCGITAAGAAYCWGRNSAGELGDGTTAEQPSPVLVLGGLTFATVSAGDNYTCGVAVDGTAYCWGLNAGQFGDGAVVPVPVAGGHRFAAVNAGDAHLCGVTTVGTAYCWGQNGTGQLGTGTNIGPEDCTGTSCSPVPVPAGGGLNFGEVDPGAGYTCGVTTAGVVYCWGSNFDGALGIGTATGPQTCGGSQCSPTPVPVSGNLSFTSVSAGSRAIHTCGLTRDGAVYCWGANRQGQLGVGTTTGPETCGLRICSTLPVLVAGGLSFAEVGAGQSHTCGVTAEGTAYCWGLNDSGQLGIGTTAGPESCQHVGDPPTPCSTVPVPISGQAGFLTVSAGAFHSCGVTADGAAYCWGENGNGQLGDGTTNQRLTPGRVVID
jgi:alpha-tubulin suppressor-like RCC1 family protein